MEEIPVRQPNQALIELYSRFFHRVPDTSGFLHYTQELQNGITLPEIAYAFAGSEEFQNKVQQAASTDVTEKVRGLYTTSLGREADGGGLDYYRDRFQRGESVGDIVHSMVTSEEYTTRAVRDLYQALLRREADQGGLQDKVQRVIRANGDAQTALRELMGHAVMDVIRISDVSEYEKIVALQRSILDKHPGLLVKDNDALGILRRPKDHVETRDNEGHITITSEAPTAIVVFFANAQARYMYKNVYPQRPGEADIGRSDNYFQGKSFRLRSEEQNDINAVCQATQQAFEPVMTGKKAS